MHLVFGKIFTTFFAIIIVVTAIKTYISTHTLNPSHIVVSVIVTAIFAIIVILIETFIADISILVFDISGIVIEHIFFTAFTPSHAITAITVVANPIFVVFVANSATTFFTNATSVATVNVIGYAMATAAMYTYG
jgi:hypothetical protein